LEVPRLLGLKPFWGIVGLTISSGVASWVEYLLLRWILRRRIGSFRLPWRFGLTLWAIAGSAAVLGIAIKSVLMWLPPFVLAGVVLGIYGVGYLAGTVWLGIPEADFLRTKLLGRLKRFLR
ncbi:MAG TPA: murein biosynthesis integral membrane protein MurJ, partial [Acidobacteriota bacterium]|nr:murein biosynthesis integral membrane protein MurJ [Acidobacteriota bacterium]